MKCYQTKNCKLSGSSYGEVYKKAWEIYLQEKKKSKRRAYIRSAYFKRDKIFLDIFWSHLRQKYRFERKRRLKFYKCAIEVMRYSTITPETKQNPNNPNELLHRFFARTSEEIFIVQIKENKRTNRKDFISVFLWK